VPQARVAMEDRQPSSPGLYLSSVRAPSNISPYEDMPSLVSKAKPSPQQSRDPELLGTDPSQYTLFMPDVSFHIVDRQCGDENKDRSANSTSSL
jgi:hypothetical protein